MKSRFRVMAATAIAALTICPVFGQLGMFSKEQRILFTPDWQGERFDDGRPKVPDEVLQRLEKTSAEEAWGTLRGGGFASQFEANWKEINPGEGRLVGRVVTAVFMPARPDVNKVINEQGRKEGRVGSGQNSWVIDTLAEGDVLVVDLFGKIKDGTFAGDNLSTSIYTKTKKGFVIEGGVRDLSGISEIKGLKGFVRGFDPSALRDVMLMGINVPIRIGNTTVMPGDVVLSDPEGLVFIPAQLAGRVADQSELTRARDEWGHQMLREQKYTPGQIDTGWTDPMIDEFNQWASQHGYKVQMRKRQR
jgi:4-hydroxy-4-methyl-2-oxoglutarate aldolase